MLQSAFLPRKPTIRNFDGLGVLEWLRKYHEVLELSSLYRLSEATVSKSLWLYTRAIQALKIEKIKWPDLWNNQAIESEVLIASVDGVHCKINEPRQTPSSQWYSHKTHGPAVCYEIAIAVRHNKVVHINGPFPAGVPDITIFRMDGEMEV